MIYRGVGRTRNIISIPRNVTLIKVQLEQIKIVEFSSK